MAHGSTEWTSLEMSLIMLCNVSMVLVLRPVRYIILGIHGLFTDAQVIVKARLELLVETVHSDREDWLVWIENGRPISDYFRVDASGRGP